MKKHIALMLTIAVSALSCLTSCSGDVAEDSTEMSSQDGSDSSEASASSDAGNASSGNSAASGESTGSTESGVSTTLISGTVSSEERTMTYSLSIPSDFEELSLEDFACYYTADDSSGIGLNVQDKDTAFDDITQELLHDTIVSSLSLTYDAEIAVTDISFSLDTVSGYPAYRYAFSYELEDITFFQLVVGIDAEQTYTFTFTDVTGSWTDTFAELADTIELQTEGT